MFLFDSHHGAWIPTCVDGRVCCRFDVAVAAALVVVVVFFVVHLVVKSVSFAMSVASVLSVPSVLPSCLSWSYCLFCVSTCSCYHCLSISVLRVLADMCSLFGWSCLSRLFLVSRTSALASARRERGGAKSPEGLGGSTRICIPGCYS